MHKVANILQTIKSLTTKITIHPKQPKFKRCPKCASAKLLGYGQIIGYGYINLDDLSVDEPGDDWEFFDDSKDLEYHCRDCGHEWEE